MSDDFKIKIKSEVDLSDAKKKIDDFTKTEHKVKFKTDTSDFDKVTEKVKSKDVEVKTKVTGQEKITNLKKDIDGAKKSTESLADSFKSISKIGLQIDLFREIEQQARKAVQAVKDIDSAIVDLQMATNESYFNMRNLMGDYNSLAKDLAATTTEIASGASDWLRQGRSISETNKLLTDSMVLSKVANIDSSTSTQQLTAMMKGYKKSVEEVSEINDSLTSIDLAAAVDASGLAEATSRVAASADLAGISLNKLLGYEAAVGEVSQESMSVIGNSFKTVFQRMGDIKAGKLGFVDEDGTVEVLSDIELVLKNSGIQLRDSANEFREFDDVLDETAAKWEKLSSVQRAAVSKAFAGTRQANRFQLLMENYDKALEYEKIANNSQGTAMKKFEENYLNSLEAKQKSLQASFESLSMNIISRESYSGIIEATQALVEFLNQTNLLKGAISGLAIGGLTKGFLSITTGLTKSAMHMQNFQKSFELLKSGNIDADGIEKLISYTDGLSKSQLKAILSSEQLTTAQRIQILTATGMDEATAKATLATMGLSAANTTATGTTLSLGTALKGLWNTLLSNPIMIVGMAVTAGVSMWQSYKQSIKEAVSSAKSAGQSFQENTSSLNSNISKVKELKSALASGTLSEQESAQAKSQLLEIQNQLVSTYGEQKAKIDLVNGSLEKELSLMNDLAVQDANKYLNENKKGIDKASDEMEKNRKTYLGQFSPFTEEGKELDKLLEKYKELGIVKEEQSDGTYTLHFDGNAMEVEETLNSFMTDLRGIADKNGGDYGYLDGIVQYTSGELDSAKKVIEEYSEIYNSALQADMISKGYGKDSPAATYKGYADAIEQYNSALSEGDTSKIEKAKTSFDKVQKSVDSVLKKYPEYKSLFSELSDTLDVTSIKAKEFQDTLNKDGFKELIVQFENLKDVDLKGINFNDDVVSDGEKALEKVIDKAIELGIVSDKSTESISEIVDMLVDMGYTGTQSAESLNKSFEQANTSIQRATFNVSKLKGIMEESVSGAGISPENLKVFKEMFGDDAEKALEKTADGFYINRKALSELQKQQEEMTQTDYLNALDEQYTALRDIESQLATAQLFKKDTLGLEASRNEIVKNISTLEDLQYQYESATSAYQKWIDAQSGGNERDMYENVLSGYEKVTDLIERGWADSDEVRTYVDLLSSKDLSTAPVEEVIAAYQKLNDTIGNSGHSILDFFTVDEQGNSTTEGIYNFFDTVQSILGEEYAKLENGKYKFNFGEGRDKDVADALNMDVEAVQAILRAAQDAGFEINLDQPISSMAELKEQAEKAKESLSDMKVVLDVDTFAEVDGEVNKVQSYIENINNSNIEPNVKATKLEEANSILEYLISRKQELGQSENIDVTVNIDETELNEGYAVLTRLKENLDIINGKGLVLSVDRANAESEIATCVSQIEAMNPELKVALGIQGMTPEQIKAGLMSGSINIPVSANTAQAKADVQSIENEQINKKDFTVTANTMQATLAIGGIKASLSTIKDKTVTVTVNKVNKNSNGESGGSSLSGTANISGTAYAGGNWGNPKSQETLVGERGVEIVVDPRTANWYTVGDNGAEFVQLPKNAIVFNDIQSKSLLKNGRINGRGKALASGTALSSGSGGIGRPSRPSSNVSASKKKKKSSSKSSDKATKEAADKSKEASESIIDFVEIAIKRLDEGIKRIKITAESVFKTFSKRNNALGQEMSEIVNKINVSQQAYNKYMSQANKVGLSENYAKQVRDGSINIETIKDENLSKKINDYQEWYDKAENIKTSIMELNEELSELAKQKFENIETEFDNRLELIETQQEQLENAIKLTETQGLLVSTSYYTSLMKSEEEIMKELMDKRTELQNSLNEAVNSGRVEEYSEAWYDMKGAINDVNTAIQESEISLKEFENEIRQLEWDTFDYLADTISSAVDEGNFLIELLSKKDLFQQKGDHKGKITNEGMAVLGQHGVNYNLEMGKADKYAAEIEKINKSLESDPYNKDLIERREELLDLQRESILNAEEEKEAMIDLVKEGVELQIEAMQDLIDKKNEALDKEKELYDYQKSIEEKSKRVKDIEKQLSSIQGDDSEENRKNIQELQNQLKEAKEDLSDAEYDKWLSDQSELMDSMLESYDETLNARFDDTDALINDLLNSTNENRDIINDTIQSSTENVGYTVTEGMKEIWSTESGLGAVVSNYANNFNEHATTVQKYLANIDAYFTSMKQKADEEAKKKQEQIANQNKPKPPSSGSGSSSKPPSNSNNGKGDGVARVGDTVTFSNGKYFYDSQGTAPAGSQLLGQTVYITRVNNKSWATKPYHIARDKAGKHPLGWVSLSQIKGYKDGTKNATKGLHFTDEEGLGSEVIVTKKGALRQLDSGDNVFNKGIVENLYDWGVINPTDILHFPTLSPVSKNLSNDIKFNFGDVILQDVQNPEQFANELVYVTKKYPKVQNAMQAVTVDRLNGGSKLGVNRIL